MVGLRWPQQISRDNPGADVTLLATYKWLVDVKGVKVRASGKLRVSPRIERARVICQSPRKNLGKERAFGARARHG